MIKTTAIIDGMACGMCEAHVQDTIRKNFDVKKVKASHAKGSAEIIAEEAIPEEALREAIAPTGYRLLSVTSEPYEKKGFKLFG